MASDRVVKTLGWVLYHARSLRDRLAPTPTDTGVYRSHLTIAQQYRRFEREVREAVERGEHSVPIGNTNEAVVALYRKDCERVGAWRIGSVLTNSQGQREVGILRVPPKG